VLEGWKTRGKISVVLRNVTFHPWVDAMDGTSFILVANGGAFTRPFHPTIDACTSASPHVAPLQLVASNSTVLRVQSYPFLQVGLALESTRGQSNRHLQRLMDPFDFHDTQCRYEGWPIHLLRSIARSLPFDVCVNMPALSSRHRVGGQSWCTLSATSMEPSPPCNQVGDTPPPLVRPFPSDFIPIHVGVNLVSIGRFPHETRIHKRSGSS